MPRATPGGFGVAVNPDLAHRALLRLGERVSFGSRAGECLVILRELERDAARRATALAGVLERGRAMSWLVYEARRLPDGSDPSGQRLFPDGEHADRGEALERAAMLAARYAPPESLRLEQRGAELRCFGVGAVYGAVVREHNPGGRS